MNNLFARFSTFATNLAISLFFFGAPIIYFFRDGIGLATNSLAFTVTFMVLPMFLVFPLHNFKVLYIPNRLTLGLGLLFIAYGFFALYFHIDRGISFKEQFYDTVVIVLTLYMVLLFSMISMKDLDQHFLSLCIFLSLLGSFALLYHIYTNPSYVLGMRASISFEVNGEENSGNPHIYSKGAFLGYVATIVMLKYSKGLIKNTILFFSLITFIVVIALSQAMSTVLATGMVSLFYLFYNAKNIQKGFVSFLKKPIAWLLIILLSVQIGVYYKKYEKIIGIGYSFIEFRVNKILGSFNSTEVKSFRPSLADDSSNMRLFLLGVVQEQMEKNFDEGDYLSIIFGNGYHDLYVDVPVVEAFNSFGLVGFLLIITFLYQMARFSFKEMKKPYTATSEFIAYAFIYFFILCFTNGLIIDYNRWGFFVLVCRFLPLNISNVEKHN